MKLILKLAGLNGLRISDILLELPTTIKYGNPKYKIRHSKEHDCYYIEKFKTRKERVEIRYLVLHSEVCELLKVVSQKHELTEIDLSMLFKDQNGLPKYKNEKTLENSIRNRLRKIGVNLGYLTLTKQFDEQGNPITKRLNGRDVEISTSDHTLGFHNFRKYYTSELMKLDFPAYIRLHMEGHAQDSKITTTYAQSLQDLGFMMEYWNKAFVKIVCSTEIRDHTDSKTLELERKQSEQFEINRKLMDTIEALKTEMRTVLDNTGTEYREYSENVPENLRLDSNQVVISKKDLKDLIASEVKKALSQTN